MRCAYCALQHYVADGVYGKDWAMTATPDPDEFGEAVQAPRLTRGQQVAHPTAAARVGRPTALLQHCLFRRIAGFQ